MRSPQTDEERGHIGAVEALVAPEAVEGAGRRLLDDLGRGARWSAATLDAAVTSRLKPVVGDDDPTLLGDRAELRDALVVRVGDDAVDVAVTSRLKPVGDDALDVAVTSRLKPIVGDAAVSARLTPIVGDDDVTLRGDREALRLDAAVTGRLTPIIGDAAVTGRLTPIIGDAAVTGRLAPIIGDDDPTIRGDRQALRDALDAAVTGRLAPIIGDDDPTIRGDRRALREAIEAFDAAKTARMPAMMERGLVSLSASDEEPTPPGDHAPWLAGYDADDLRGDDPWAPIEGADYDPQITLRGDRRAAGLAMRAAAAPHPLSFADTLPKPPPIPPRAEPPALPLPLVRRADRWLEELPEAARRVLDEARELRPSWPLRERTEGAVLKPKQKIPSLRPPAP